MSGDDGRDDIVYVIPATNGTSSLGRIAARTQDEWTGALISRGMFCWAAAMVRIQKWMKIQVFCLLFREPKQWKMFHGTATY